MDTKQFVTRLAEELKRIEEDRGLLTPGNQFAVWVGTTLFDIDENQVVEENHLGGSNDNKADIGIISEEGDDIVLVQCKINEKVLDKQSLDKNHFNKDVVDEVLAAATRLKDSGVSGNKKWQVFAERVRATEVTPRLILALLGNMEASAMEYARTHGVEVWDLKEILHQYEVFFNPAGAVEPENFTITAGPHGSIEYNIAGEGTPRLVLLTLTAHQLSTLVGNWGTGLFQKNLRFAKTKNKLSRKIREGIHSTLETEGDRLAFKHNGITIVCDEISPKDDKLLLTRPQIVNGCQTSYAIYDFYRANPDHPSRATAYLFAKIVDDIEQIETLTETSNLQNPISFRDRKANDQLQQDILGAFGDKEVMGARIFYEKKEGEWSSVEQNKKQSLFKVPGVKGRTYRRLTNGLAGQLQLSLLGAPHDAREKKGILFEDNDVYRAGFNFHLLTSDRAKLIESDLNVLRPDVGGVDAWCHETFFAFAIYRLANVASRKLLDAKRKAAKGIVLDALHLKDYWKYFGFHLAWAVRYVLNERAEAEGREIREMQQALLGKDVNLWFSSPAKLMGAFPLDGTGKNRILFKDEGKEPLRVLSKWLGRIDEIVYQMVTEDERTHAFTNHNKYWGKRSATVETLKERLDDALTGPDGVAMFPVPNKPKSSA